MSECQSWNWKGNCVYSRVMRIRQGGGEGLVSRVFGNEGMRAFVIRGHGVKGNEWEGGDGGTKNFQYP